MTIDDRVQAAQTAGAGQRQARMNGTANVVQALTSSIRDNIQKVIVGKDDPIDLALIALLCRGHVLIEDVPGTGKTTLSKALAWSLDCDFHRIQFTPDLMPGDVLGVNFFNMKEGQFEFRPGPVFSQVLLADEINRATPRTQSALLEAMQERQASIDGVTMPLPDPFLVMATLNPIEMEGTFPLPEAQLDRFMVRIAIGYPSHTEESEMLVRFRAVSSPERIAPVANAASLREAEAIVMAVRLDDHLRDYLLQIIEGTRAHPQLQLGASPRASLALHRAAQARAAMRGRDYVLPDDIKALAAPVLAHRLIISSQARLRGRRADDIIEEVVRSIPVPMERE